MGRRPICGVAQAEVQKIVHIAISGETVRRSAITRSYPLSLSLFLSPTQAVVRLIVLLGLVYEHGHTVLTAVLSARSHPESAVVFALVHLSGINFVVIG